MIAFASNRDAGGIFVVRPDGTGIRRVTPTKGKAPEWSPDGKEHAFEAPDGLRLVSPTGERERLLVRVTSRGERSLSPAWSPDGKQIAFVRRVRDGSDVVFVVARRGGAARRLLEPALDPDDPTWSAFAASELTPAWSPDGKRVAYGNGDGELFVAPIVGGRRDLIATEARPMSLRGRPTAPRSLPVRREPVCDRSRERRAHDAARRRRLTQLVARR